MRQDENKLRTEGNGNDMDRDVGDSKNTDLDLGEE